MCHLRRVKLLDGNIKPCVIPKRLVYLCKRSSANLCPNALKKDPEKKGGRGEWVSNERSKERTDFANKSAKRSSHKVDALFSCSRTCCGTSLSCGILRNGSIGQRHPFSVLFCLILLKNVRRAFSKKKAVTVWGLSKKKKRSNHSQQNKNFFPFLFLITCFCSFVVVFQDEELLVVLYESSQVKHH